MTRLVQAENVVNKIFQIRGKNVMLDKHLADLYEVPTKVLIQAVKRNKERFPEDFMFQLAKKELSSLKSQFVTSSWGGRRYLPYAFTEQGVAMLSSVLRSKRAILVNIQIMRAFVNLRRAVLTYIGLKRKIEAMEKKYNGQFKVVFKVIKKIAFGNNLNVQFSQWYRLESIYTFLYHKKLLEPPVEKKRRIGFYSD